MQLQWAQKENLEWIKRYEKLKSELDEMKRLYCGAAVGNGGLCEDLAKERDQLETLRTELAATRRLYDHAIDERNRFGKRLADIRKAAWMSDYDETDLVEYITQLHDAISMPNRYKWLYENLKDGVESILREAEEKED